MDEEYTLIDFDGVILDSEERMLDRKFSLGLHNHKDKNEFYLYFEYANYHPEEWDYIIREANSINGSVEIIRELEKFKKNIAILTKVHSLVEMKVKIDDLRNNRKIFCPIFFVLPGIEKYEVITPNHQLLIDDSEKNINLWIENGGKGLIFDKTINENNDCKVRSLELLLRR